MYGKKCFRVTMEIDRWEHHGPCDANCSNAQHIRTTKCVDLDEMPEQYETVYENECYCNFPTYIRVVKWRLIPIGKKHEYGKIRDVEEFDTSIDDLVNLVDGMEMSD